MILYDYIFNRDPGLLGKILEKKSHSKAYYDWRDTQQEKLEALDCQRFLMPTGFGYDLAGFYYQFKKHPSKKIAFIIHGYRSNHAETAGPFIEFYKSQGFDVFCPDNPAHGDSGGRLISFGFYESIYALKWIDFLKKRFGENIEIVIHGFSLGGGTAIMMSDSCPDNVKFIVDDCGMISASSSLRPKLGLLYEPMRFLNKIIAGYDLKKADARPHIENNTIPILFVHGKNDHVVPFLATKELYENCKTDKDYLLVNNAKHMESYYLSPGEYKGKLSNFIRLYV